MSNLLELTKILAEVHKETDEYKKLATEAADLLPEFGPIIYKILESVVIGVAKLSVIQFKYYISNGLSREEALVLVTSYSNHLANINKK